ncbi:uncharacterized protein LOC116409849 isoform X3 [Xenopus tropicalis]|uniref:Uncharacterized protein LOC116409849 isoform X3 n=1 Tax=Xenopus tropicalis TaxID=8364 RepID=A0A8J1JFM1_XENTR|nr:uncharacterized protein LOC116409849 isoform X3 [Xenopus tropicalis]
MAAPTPGISSPGRKVSCPVGVPGWRRKRRAGAARRKAVAAARRISVLLCRAPDGGQRTNEPVCASALVPPGNCPTNHSSRVLYHPSFQAFCAAVALRQGALTLPMQNRKKEGFTLNCADYFYSDPLMSPGHRTYNCLSPGTQEIFSCFSLNTPAPIMAPCEYLAAPKASPSAPPLALAGSSHTDTRCLSPQYKMKEVENQVPESPFPPGGAVSTFPKCSPSEADAVCALLSLSGACPPRSGQ